MTLIIAMRNSKSLRELRTLIQGGKGQGGIYALAKEARRPYRRVYDQVMRLAAAGEVRLKPLTSAGRKRLRVLPVESGTPVS